MIARIDAAAFATELRTLALTVFHRCDDAADVIEWYTGELMARLATPGAEAAAPAAEATKEALADLIRGQMTGVYHCTRVWEAWNVGTMGQDDFEPYAESDSPDELADAILAHLAALAAQPEANPWHDAVLAACMSIECAYQEANPAKTLNDLIEWHRQDAQPEAPAVPAGWESVIVNEGFFPLMESLARAHRNGYMPDAITDDYEGFDYRAMPAAAPAAPAVDVPPMPTDEQIESHRQWACDWGVLNKHPAGRFAERLIAERDKQWIASGVRS